ncbi:MAG: Dabb family protein [Bryobacteraceae bacterium]|nr:Dabb family protein [Bryobacteraceae bacterium]
MNRILLTAAAVTLLGASLLPAQNKYEKPKSIIHVVTLHYKDGTTPEQRQAVLDGIEKMAAAIPGVNRIWLKPVKVQGGYVQKLPSGETKVTNFTDAFVMEFKDAAALKVYENHPAHREWEKVYLEVRGRSSTSDISN